MSDVMLFGVLRMPPELWRDDEIDIAQRHARYVEAADRIQELEDDYMTQSRNAASYCVQLSDAKGRISELEAEVERYRAWFSDHASVLASHGIGGFVVVNPGASTTGEQP